MACTMMEKLLSCDYPFRWRVQSEIDIAPDDMIERLTEQLDEKVFEEEFRFELLMLYVGLAYEYSLKNHTEKAIETLEIGENKFQEFKDRFSRSISDALQHIILSTKSHLFLQNKDLDRASSIISNIPLTDEMDKESNAALYGLRAAFFSEFGIDGSKVALGFASKAIELDPGTALWYFLKGKYLGRIRRVERSHDIPLPEEREHLEKALEFERNPSFMVFTAQLYRETATCMYYLHRRNPPPREKSEIDELNLKAMELYDESIKLKPKCPNMMFRCARGYIALPPPFREQRSEQAGTLLENGLKKAPNSGYGNHGMGQYYEKVKKQPEEAMKYLKICEKKKIFGGTMDLVRLEYRTNKRIDLAQRLSDLLEVYPEKRRQCQLLSQLISHNLLNLIDLDKACSLAAKVMLLEPDCKDMTEHRPLASHCRDPINLYDVIIDHISIEMPKVSGKRKKCYEKFMSDYVRIGKAVPPSAEPRYLANPTQRRMFAPRNNVPTRPDFQKPPFSRNQPGEARPFNCNRKYGQRPEDSKYPKKKSYTHAAPSSHNWRSRPQSVIQNETVSEGSKFARTADRKVPAPIANKNDDSDDCEFRMMIYEKSKQKVGTEANPTASKPNDLVLPLQKMKIRDAPKEDSLPSEKRRENDSKLPDKKPPTESKCAEGGKEKHSDDLNRRSQYHETHRSKHSRRRSYSRDNDDDDNDDSRRHRESKRSHRRKNDYSPDDEDERRYRDHRSSKHRSKHSRRRKSSESEDDYRSESRSVASRRRHRRSSDRKSKRSHRRRSSSDESGTGSDVERGSVASRRRNHRSADRKSKRSYRRRSSSSESERRSVTSRRRDHRSPEHKSKNSRRRSKDDGRRHRRSHDREVEKSRRKRHSSESSDDTDHKSVTPKRSDNEGYYYKSEHSRHNEPQKKSRDVNVDKTPSRSNKDHSRLEEPARHSKGSDNNFEPQSTEEVESKDLGTGDFVFIKQVTSQSDGRDKHKPKHSRDKGSDSESGRRSYSSKLPDGSKHESKYSHRKRCSDSEKDDSKRGIDVSKRDKGRSLAREKRESKKSRRKGYSSHSEDESERENMSRRNDYHASSGSRRKYEGERSLKSRRDEDQHRKNERGDQRGDRDLDPMSAVLEKVSKKFEPKTIFSNTSD